MYIYTRGGRKARVEGSVTRCARGRVRRTQSSCRRVRHTRCARGRVRTTGRDAAVRSPVWRFLYLCSSIPLANHFVFNT